MTGNISAQESRVGIITVGPNVHVSAAHPDRFHDEMLLATDPLDSRRLLACSMVFSPEADEWGIIVYTSSDGGATWKPSIETSHDYHIRNADPACAFGPDHNAFLSHLVDNEETPDSDVSHLNVYWSSDMGQTWTASSSPGDLGRFFDREYLVADNISTSHRGTVYLYGQFSPRRVEPESGFTPMGIALLRSLDGGRTFERPVVRIAEATGKQSFHLGNGVVLSDGTFVCLVEQMDMTKITDPRAQPRQPNGILKVLVAPPGGDSLGPGIEVATLYKEWGEDVGMPSLGIDPGSRDFKDRLYAVWGDWQSEPRHMLLAYSADRGKTWSKPVVVNEPRRLGDKGLHANDFMPMVAANEKGIVGVAWHDRRESADRRGWVLRFAVSFDGGESFTPSERISEGAMNADDNAKFRMLASHRPATGIDPHHVALIGGKWITGGHTNGISVDARGAFHLLWSDNRTGVDQLWTAAVIVRGEGVLHGDPTLTALDDISKDLGIEATNTTYDSVEHTVVTHIRLINLSSAPICGPLKVRATGVRSEIGTPTLLNAQNREPGAGAIWTVYPQLPEKCLVPKASSSEFIISAHLVDLQPMSESADREFLSLDLRIFGPARRGGS